MGKKYQNRKALAVVVCNAITATITCSSESTDGTFSVFCGQMNQHLYHLCWSLIFFVVINLVPFAACLCDLNLITKRLWIEVDMFYIRSLRKWFSELL